MSAAREPGVPDGLMDLHEAAEYLSINPRTLWRRANTGDVPALRLWDGVRSPLRFRRADLEIWLERRRVAPVRLRAAGRAR